MNTKELCRFIMKAKSNTYASGIEGAILKDGSKELIFSEGKFVYRDRYFGDSPFIGEEIVFYEDKYVWGMNYYGFCFYSSGSISSKEVYAFLRGALKRVSEAKPFRGPEKYEEDHMIYINNVEGDLGRFMGIEKILYKGEEIYKLLYHGGSAKSEN